MYEIDGLFNLELARDEDESLLMTIVQWSALEELSARWARSELQGRLISSRKAKEYCLMHWA